jgi:hypothetical protein
MDCRFEPKPLKDQGYAQQHIFPEDRKERNTEMFPVKTVQKLDTSYYINKPGYY